MKPIFNSLSSASINLIFVLLSVSVFSTNEDLLIRKSESKEGYTSKEKIYIHFDKSFYNQGENIWYKVYLVDAINLEPETLSKVVYVDLISPNNAIIESRSIKINEGTGHGDFKLPEDIIDGAYIIRAYTNFMRNFDDSHFFIKKIYVNLLEQNNDLNIDTTSVKPHISFSPEGGNMIYGVLNRIVVRATNALEKGIPIKGEILDDTNNNVFNFETSKFGLGSFQFIPQKGRTYTAIIAHNGEKYAYLLPPVIDNGATIRVDKTHNGYRANVYSSLHNGIDGLELLGMQKGDIVCQAKLNANNTEAAVDFPKSDLKYGLIQFQLLNKNGTLISEELAFIDSNNLEQKITVTPSKKVYENNELAEIEINHVLEDNLKANISVSVTEVNPTKNDISDLDIKSHLLLNPELRDDIQQFGYYHSNDSQRKKMLNLLLMSQDGNQHVFKDSITNNELTFLHESGFSLKGTIKEVHKGKPVKASVTVTYKNSNEIGYDKTITDSLGRFNFNALNFDERTFVAIKAKRLNARNYSRDYIIELDSVIPPLVNTKRILEKNTKKSNTFLESKIKQHRNTEFAPQKGEIKLNEIKLTATKKREDRYTEKRKMSLYTSASHTLDVKNSKIIAHNPLQALQGKFPGFDVIGRKIIIRGIVYDMGETSDPFKIGTPEEQTETGKGGPLFLVDGFPSDYDLVVSMPIHDIDFIDIVKGPRTAIYGVRGGAGVIAVYTLDGSEENDELNNRNVTTSFYQSGYYQARKFYQDENNPSTLYWNPDLKLEQSNTAKIAFKTANKSATYKVLLEGITSNGIPFKTETFFDVK